MTQMPRSYRRQYLEQKIGLHNPGIGLCDVQTVANMRKAVQIELDRQDREYQTRQAKETLKMADELRKLF